MAKTIVWDNNVVSISIITEDMITLVISWRPMIIMSFVSLYSLIPKTCSHSVVYSEHFHISGISYHQNPTGIDL